MNEILQKDLNKLEQDCAVCLQKCQHPAKLPCGHIFCFLCVKGVAFQGRKCAMCRSAIPVDYLDNPVLLEDLTTEQLNQDDSQDANQWYYEGRNGWWKYDERSNAELESAYSDDMPDCTLLLAGALYVVDFQAMTQTRQSDRTRRRRVRRETSLFPAKGIAGIKTEKICISNTKDENQENSNVENDTENSNTENINNDVEQHVAINLTEHTNGQPANVHIAVMDSLGDRLSTISVEDSHLARDTLEDT